MIIQAAIDIIELNKAIDVAGMALDAGADWIELGYPLIKFEGMSALGAFRKAFPDTYLLADCTIIAGADKYIKKAAEEAINNITCSFLAPSYSVKAAIDSSKARGVEITVDLFNTEDTVNKAVWAESQGADYVMVHFGLDQMKYEPEKSPLNILEAVTDKISIPVSFATYTVEQGIEALKKGAEILVQGYPFLEDKNPKEKFKEYIDSVKSFK